MVAGRGGDGAALRCNDPRCFFFGLRSVCLSRERDDREGIGRAGEVYGGLRGSGSREKEAGL